MHPVSVLPVFLCGYHLLCCLRVTVWVVEHAQFKLFLQGPGHRPCQSLIGQHQITGPVPLGHRMALGRVISVPAPLICFPGGKYIQGSADDIHSGIDSQRDSGRHIQLLHPPGHLVGDAGVAVHISLKSHLFPQKPLYERPVKRKSYRLHLHDLSARTILGPALGS